MAELLLNTRDPEAVAWALSVLLEQNLGTEARSRAVEIAHLLAQHRDACHRIVGMLALDSWTDDQAVDDAGRLAACRRLFDDLVAHSEEASVALYSLGDSVLLEQATTEVVDRMQTLGLLGPTRTLLQIGCGIGRFELALAGRVAEAHGVDLSPKMVAAAVRRCGHLPNVHIRLGSGRDLAPYGDGQFDLVYAVDSMPYVVEAGEGVVRNNVREAVRVLKPSGKMLIYNYSYRGDSARDSMDVLDLAERFGFDVKTCGAAPFVLWNGVEYLLERRADAAVHG